MDPSRVDEFDDVLIILKIFGAEMVGEFEQEFPAQHLVPVHVGYVLELRINWNQIYIQLLVDNSKDINYFILILY